MAEKGRYIKRAAREPLVTISHQCEWGVCALVPALSSLTGNPLRSRFGAAMVTSRPPGVLLTVAVVLLRLCIGVIAQAEDEAFTNGLTAVDIIRIGDEDDDMIVGVAGNDYPTYAEVPDTSFRCEDQQSPGYFADQEAECQVFHICVAQGRRIQKFSFLCPNGTIFDQQYLVCVWWYSFDCAQASQFYSVNDGVFSDTGSAASPDGSNVGNPRFSGATGSVGGQPGSPREGGSAGSGSGFPNQGLGGSTGQAGLAGQPGSLGQPGSGGQGTAFGGPGSTDGFGPADRRPGSTGGAGTRDGRPGPTGGAGTRDGRPGSIGGAGTRDGRLVRPGSTGGAGTRDGRPGSTGGAGTRDGRPGSTGGAGTRDGRPGSTGGAGTRDGRPGSAGRGQESLGPQGGFPATQGGFPRPSASGQPGQNNFGQNVADFPRQTQGQGGFGSPGLSGNAINQNGFGPGQNIGDSGLGQVQGSSGPGQAGFSSQQPGRGIGQNGLGLSQQQPGQTEFGTTQGSFGPQRPSSSPGQAGFGQGQRGSTPGQSGFEQTGFGPGQNQASLGLGQNQRQPTPGQSGFSSGQPGSAPGQNDFGSGQAFIPGQGLTGSTPSQGGIGSGQTGFSGPGQTGTTQSQGFGPGQTQTGFRPGQTQQQIWARSGDLGQVRLKQDLGQVRRKQDLGQVRRKQDLGQVRLKQDLGQVRHSPDLDKARSNQRQTDFGPGQNQIGFGSTQTGPGLGFDAGQSQPGSTPGQGGFAPGQAGYSGPSQTGSGQSQPAFGTGQTQTGSTPGFGSGQTGFGPGLSQAGQRQTGFGPGQSQLGSGPGVGPTRGDQSGGQFGQSGFSSPGQVGTGPSQAGIGIGQTALNQGRPTQNEGSSGPEQNTYQPNLGQAVPQGQGQGGIGQNQLQFDAVPGQDQSGIGQNQGQFGTGLGQNQFAPNQGQGGFGTGPGQFGQREIVAGQTQPGFGPGQNQNEYQSDQQQTSFGPDVSSQSDQGSPSFGTDLNQGDVGLGVSNVIQDGISNQGSTRQTGDSQGQDIGYNYPTPETSLFIGSGPAQADFGTSGIDGTLDVQDLNQDEILLIDDQDSFDGSYQGEGGFQQPGQQTDFSSNNIGNTGISGNPNEFLLIENQDPAINIGNIQDEIIVQHSEIPTSGGNLNNFGNTAILTGDTGTNAFNPNAQGNSGYQNEQIQGNQDFQVNNNAQGNEILLTDDNVGFSGNQNIAEGNGYSYPDPSSVSTGTSLNDNQQTFSVNVPLPPQSLGPITSGLPGVSDDTIFIFTSNNDNDNLGTTPYSDLPASKPASESHSQAEAPVPAGGFEPAITNFGSVSPGGLTQTTSGDFGLSSTGGITSNNAGGVPLPPQDYIPPTQEFAAQEITNSQGSPQFSFSGSSSGNISPNTFSFSSTPVSLTDSLKQEVVAPVTQEADSRFTFPSQPSIGSTLDFSTLEQGYLPPVDNAGISNNIQPSNSPSLPELSPGSISFPSSSPSPFPGSGFSSTASSPSSSYPGDSTSSLEPSVSTSPQNPISFNPVSSVSSQSLPAGSPISGNGVNVGTTQSFPAGSGNAASGGNFGNVGNQQGGQQAISTPLDLGYLPPVSEFTRNTRQTGQHDNKIYVTPLPGVEKSFREVSGRRAFRPSVRITDGMDKLEFKPKTPAKPFGRVFFPSNRRSDTAPVRYIDNSRKSFVATSSSPFNPFNQYSLSLRS
nr:collagen alpha-2(IV) chain-like [Penaeus vannamei]